jgi:uncharacterized protein (DUF427 family)
VADTVSFALSRVPPTSGVHRRPEVAEARDRPADPDLVYGIGIRIVMWQVSSSNESSISAALGDSGDAAERRTKTMTRAIWNGAVIAESDDTVVVDRRHYFPRDSVNLEYLQASRHTSRCAWKGTASYYTLLVDGKSNRDAAWYYEEPTTAAAAVAGRIAFWRGVKIEKTSTEGPLKRRRIGFRRRAISASRRPNAGSADPNVVGELDD